MASSNAFTTHIPLRICLHKKQTTENANALTARVQVSDYLACRFLTTLGMRQVGMRCVNFWHHVLLMR
jgi:hypothetical protein